MTEWIQRIEGRLSDKLRIRAQLAVSRAHYVYILCRPNGTPFYVGKGIGTRLFHHEAEARTTERLTHKLNVIRAIKRRGGFILYCIESSFDSEEEAHARERVLIALFGRHDQGRGPLTNQTDGGEGASNPSEESRERHRQTLGGEAEDDDRRIANRWFHALCQAKSVPIKPSGGTYRAGRLYANRPAFGRTERQAAALAASAIANRVVIRPGSIIPRRMTVDGVAMVIEDGAGRDIITSGMALLADAAVGYETLELTAAGYSTILEFVDCATLEDAGVLIPVID